MPVRDLRLAQAGKEKDRDKRVDAHLNGRINVKRVKTLVKDEVGDGNMRV